MTEVGKQRFQMIKAEMEGGRRRLGELDFSADGWLSVASAEADSPAYLERLVALLNAKPVLHVAVPPPADAPRYALYSRGIARWEPEFFDALQAFLAKNYGVFLAPPGGPIDEALFPPTELSAPGPRPA